MLRLQRSLHAVLPWLVTYASNIKWILDLPWRVSSWWKLWCRYKRFADGSAARLAARSLKQTTGRNRGSSAGGSPCLQQSMLVSGDGRGELIVGFDERQEGVLIGRRVVRVDVSLHGSRSGLTSLHKLFDQLVSDQFRRRGRLDDLKEKFARCPSFFNPLSEFMWGWETAWFMVSSEVVLLVRIRWWRVIGAGGALQACIRPFKHAE